MKKLWMLLFVLTPFCAFAQQTEYNKNGDEAMKRLDYRDARLWFEEGVLTCDSYSIDKLVTIWLSNEEMRPSMRSVMNKCMDCLTEKAMKGDTVSMSKLIICYGEGIGIPSNKNLSNYWSEQLENIRKQNEILQSPATEKAVQQERMKFFVGYSYSIEAPFGITFGGVGQRLGWYGRFKTNLSFENTLYQCRKAGESEELIDFHENSSYEFVPGEKKTNTYSATAGLVVKFTPWLYTSFGGGYGKRDLLWKYVTHDKNDYDNTKIAWAKNEEASHKGVALEIDLMIKFNSFYISGGVNSLGFEYSDLNAGVGIFF